MKGAEPHADMVFWHGHHDDLSLTTTDPSANR
jgi:hypothetical protein